MVAPLVVRLGCRRPRPQESATNTQATLLSALLHPIATYHARLLKLHRQILDAAIVRTHIGIISFLQLRRHRTGRLLTPRGMQHLTRCSVDGAHASYKACQRHPRLGIVHHKTLILTAILNISSCQSQLWSRQSDHGKEGYLDTV
jgi:hypothetical protein